MIAKTPEELELIGEKIGRRLRGGEVIELIGDVGAGKTTFTRGLARGLNINDPIVSPSFTINCNYAGRDDLTLHHYDFYRLEDAGIINMELAESANDNRAVTVVEWAETVHNTLPNNRVVININYLPDQGREITVTSGNYGYLLD